MKKIDAAKEKFTEEDIESIAKIGRPSTCPSYFGLQDIEKCLSKQHISCGDCWDEQIKEVPDETPINSSMPTEKVDDSKAHEF